MELPLLYSAWSPSSPSLDMEATVQQLSSSCAEPQLDVAEATVLSYSAEPQLDVAGNPEPSSSSEDPDGLLMDPFLDYINEVLMEEGMEDDAACMQQDADLTYQAIVDSFYNIIGGHLPPNSSVISTCSEDVCDVHIPHQISSCYEKGPDEQHVEVCSRGKDAVDEGLINHRSYSGKEQGISHRSYSGQEQCNDPFKLPTTDEELLSDIDISFQDLKLESDYTALYVEEPSFLCSATRPARGSVHNTDKNKSLVVAGKSSRKSKHKGTSQVQGFVDLREVLVSCAQSVAVGDTRMAHEILQGLRLVHGASAKGSGLQRIAHYFSEALVARMRGTGGDQFRVMTCNMPSSAALLKALRLGLEVAPYLKIMHYFANQSILKAAEGSSRLHIVDYGSHFGMQWPFLINTLADRKGGPPLLVITAIEFPQLSHNPAQILEDSGRRLAAYARIYNVPFQFHAIVTSEWGDHDAVSLHLHEDEVLVLNCMKGLRHLADESVDLASNTSPRQKILTFMRNLNPHLLLFADLSAAYSSPFFASRFREALYFYSNLFDMLDILWDDSPERLIVERSCCYRDIVNIVACEGAERVERPEAYKQWGVRIKRASFEQLPIPPTILSRSKSHVKQHYHKDFMVHDDANGWLLLGWKGRVILATSAWKPSP